MLLQGWYEMPTNSPAPHLAAPPGLFETHNNGRSYQPAPHTHVHMAGEDGGHLGTFELVGSVLGVALMQVGDGGGWG